MADALGSVLGVVLALALVNIGNLGGFVGPAMIGRIKDSTDGFLGGLDFVAGLLVISAVLTLFLARSISREAAGRLKS